MLNFNNLIIPFLFFLLTSCSSELNNQNRTELHNEKLELLTVDEMIREILITNNGNYNQLACILNCSPSTLKRIKENETLATQSAKNEIRKLYTILITEEINVNNLKADCITYKWYDHVKSFMSNRYFWITLLLLTVFRSKVLSLIGGEKFDGWFGVLFVFAIFIYILVWILNLFGGEPDFLNIEDDFINTIDTLWEVF